MSRSSLLAVPFAGLLLVSCRFRDLTPGGSRHEEAALQGVVGQLYQAIAARDLRGVQRVTEAGATVIVASSAGPVLVPMRTMVDVPERRNQAGGAHITRTDLRVDGDVATDRVVVAARSADGRREYEAADLLTLARRGGQWRVAHVAFGAWRNRSAP